MNQIVNKIISVMLSAVISMGIFNLPVYANNEEIPVEESVRWKDSLQYLVIERPYVSVLEPEKIYVSISEDVAEAQLLCVENGYEIKIEGDKIGEGLFVFEHVFEQEGEVILSSISYGESQNVELQDVSFHVKNRMNSHLPENLKAEDSIYVYGNDMDLVSSVKTMLIQNGILVVEDVELADYAIQLFQNESEVYYANQDISLIQGELNLASIQEEDTLLDEFYIYEGDAENIANMISSSFKQEIQAISNTNIEDGKYTIHLSEVSDYVVDVKWGLMEDGTNIRLYTSNGTSAQVWNVVHDAFGNVSFLCEKSNKALTLNGDNIEQSTYMNTSNQKWNVLEDGRIASVSNPDLYMDYEGNVLGDGTNLCVSKVGRSFVFKIYDPQRDVLNGMARENKNVLADGKYEIKSSKNNAYGVRMDGTNAELYQSSYLWQVRHDEQGYVSFIDTKTNKALTIDVIKNSQNVYGKEFENTYNQKWIVLSDGTIVSAMDSKFVLDLHHGSVINGSNIQIYTSNGTTAQKWKFIRFDENREQIHQKALENKDNIKDGNYSIHLNSDPNYVVDVKWGSTEDGANIRMYSDNGTTAQRWKVSHDENGYVIFTCLKSGKVMGMNGTNIEQQTNENTYGQKWIVLSDGTIMSAMDQNIYMTYEGMELYDGVNAEAGEKETFIFRTYDPQRDALNGMARENRNVLADGEYYIQSGKNTDYVLSWSATNAELSKNRYAKEQVWSISHDEKGYVTITKKDSNEVLSVSGDDVKNYQNVELRPMEGSFGQKWIVLSDGTIVSAMDSKFVLDLHHGSVTNGSNIQIYTSNGTTAQKWKFEGYDENRAMMNQMAQENKNVLSDGMYLIQLKRDPNYVVDVKWGSTDDGANVRLYEFNDTTAQKWRVSHDSKGYITFTCEKSKKVLTVNGNNVEQASNKNTYNQKWIVLSDGKIVSALDSDMVLGSEESSISNGVNLCVSNGMDVFLFERQIFTGFVEEDNALYYYDQSGNLLKGNIRVGNVLYKTNNQGKIIESHVQNVKYFCQQDSRWANQIVGGAYFGPTGCVPTVITMYMNYLNGENRTPVDWGRELNQHGLYNYSVMGAGGDVWNYIAKKYNRKVTTNMNLSQLKMALLQGKVVPTAVGPGKFCPAGYTHEILIHSLDSSGNVYVLDPLVPGNNGWYPLSRLFEQRSQDRLDWYDKSNNLSTFVTLQ